MFRFKSGIKVSYEKQGYIYFTSLRFRELSPGRQQKILNLCAQCGGEHHRALFEFVTTDASATAICGKHYLSKSTLYRIVRQYYEKFPEQL